MARQRFVVLCVGYEDAGDHVEYIFHVTHVSGGDWQIRRRFSDLASAHARLSNLHQDLPPFPEKGLPGLGLILGRELVVRRVNALQRFFEGALARDEVARAPDLQNLLGMQRPKAVSSVRVLRWLPLNEGSSGIASVELEVGELQQSPNGPVEELLAAPRATGGAAPALSTGRPGAPLRVDGLPCGEEVIVEVCARNGVGVSDAVVVRLRVPGRRRTLGPDMRVQAVWGGDGARYDATVKRMNADGSVVVNWMRPMPLSNEPLVCVCEAGGDDTTHRVVPREWVVPLVEPADHDASGDLEEQVLVATKGSNYHETPPEASPLCRARALGQVGTAAEAPMVFRLSVRLHEERIEQLEWRLGDELAPRIQAFIVACHLKPLFTGPLLTAAELMVQKGHMSDSVDIVDLV